MKPKRVRKCVSIRSDMNEFANAVRGVLGLDPLFFDEEKRRKRAPGVSKEEDEMRRFYVAPWFMGNGRVDYRGRARRHSSGG